MADTLSTNISASYNAMVERTIAQMPQSAPMLSLARKMIVPKGANSAQIPRVSSVSSVQTPAEGQELSTTSRFTLASSTISPTFRAIYVRIHIRAINYSQEDLVKLVSDEMALSQGQDIDTDLTGEFANWHTDNDLGATGKKLTLKLLRNARRTLQTVPRSKGGPPRGRPIVNVLRIDGEEQITTMLPQPSEGTDAEAASELVFATRAGYVRRNRMSDFASINVNGKIAMKLDPGDTLVGVAEVTPDTDLMLATRRGRAIRFPMDEVRVFVGRASRGVRGVRFQRERQDQVIGMSVLPHTDASPELRKQYLRYTASLRRNETPTDPPATVVLKQLAAEEVFVLSVTEQGFGKQTSSHEYRTTARGGQGVINIQTEGRNGPAVCCFPVAQTDEVMVVTDLGRIIRCPVSDIRVAGRGAQGVRVLRLDSSEKVVSVTRFDASADDEAEGGLPSTRIPEEISSSDGEIA